MLYKYFENDTIILGFRAIDGVMIIKVSGRAGMMNSLKKFWLQHRLRFKQRFAAVITLLLAANLSCGESDETSDDFPLISSHLGRPVGYIYSEPGELGLFSVASYPIKYDSEEFGVYSADIYYPESQGNNEDMTAAGLYPGIVLTNGYFAPAYFMTWYSEHLASHGYVVLASTCPNTLSFDVSSWAEAFRAGISTLLQENERPGSPLAGTVNPDRFGVIGLSMGGAGALEAAGTDDRIDAVVSLAPATNDYSMFIFQESLQAAREVKVPVQIQIGSRDCIINPEPENLFGFTNVTGMGVMYYYEALTSLRQYIEIRDGTHMDYLDKDILTISLPFVVDLLRLDCPVMLPIEEHHYITAKYATMWFDTYLYGAGGWQDALFGGGPQADLETGRLSNFKWAPQDG